MGPLQGPAGPPRARGPKHLPILLMRWSNPAAISDILATDNQIIRADLFKNEFYEIVQNRFVLYNNVLRVTPW